MTESLKETMIRIAKTYNLDVPEFLTERNTLDVLYAEIVRLIVGWGGACAELEQLKRDTWALEQKQRAEIEQLRVDVAIAVDTIVQQQGEIKQLREPVMLRIDGEILAVLEKREALLARLWRAVKHLPPERIVSILTSPLPLQELENLVRFQEDRD